MAEQDLTTAIDLLDKRMAKIEGHLEGLTTLLQNMMATASDVADEAIAKHCDATGITPDERVKAVGQLANRLSDPQTIARLDRLLDRLDLVEKGLEQAEDLPNLISTTADMADQWAMQANQRGILIDERLKKGLDMLELMTRPEVTESLGILVERLTDKRITQAIAPLLEQADQLETLSQQIQSLPHMVATFTDSADAFIAAAQKDGLDLDALLSGLKTLASLASQLFNSKDFIYHIQKGLLAPETVRVISSMGEALATTHAQPRGEAGVFAAIKAMREPEVARAVDFALSFARNLGQALDEKPLALPH